MFKEWFYAVIIIVWIFIIVYFLINSRKIK